MYDTSYLVLITEITIITVKLVFNKMSFLFQSGNFFCSSGNVLISTGASTDFLINQFLIKKHQGQQLLEQN